LFRRTLHKKKKKKKLFLFTKKGEGKRVMRAKIFGPQDLNVLSGGGGKSHLISRGNSFLLLGGGEREDCFLFERGRGRSLSHLTRKKGRKSLTKESRTSLRTKRGKGRNWKNAIFYFLWRRKRGRGAYFSSLGKGKKERKVRHVYL